MNRKMVFHTVGRLLEILSLLLLLPTAVALIYRESCVWAFVITICVSLGAGFVMEHAFRPNNHIIYAREGFAIVGLIWVLLSLFGALPFVISGEIPSFIDAWFETVSGFTTTGASIITDIESMSHGILFWRSFTHWIGGMGVLVFIMALIPNISDRSIHLLRAEVPGPVVGKLVPRIKDTAKILYLIYIFLTIVETVLLLLGGMPLFESLVHAFGTAGTGGFGVKANSISGYSPYLQWVIAIFMIFFGVNFNLYYMILIKRTKAAFSSLELWLYVGLIVGSSIIIGINIFPIYNNIADTARYSVFQTASIVTTTGYSTADFNLWPGLSKAILLLLMFCGGCAGSTAGGIKMSRLLMLFKMIGREIRHMIHPRSVSAVRMEGKQVEEGTLGSVGIYFALYIFCTAVVFLILSVEPFDIETNLTATVSCFNNVGPGFGAVGPTSTYMAYSPLSKIVLSFAMLFGRLEIYPMLLALLPSVWAKKK